MPLTLICRRCNTEVQTDDRFCQECGLDLPATRESDNSPIVPQSGNSFDFSPNESKQFEWPSLAEDLSSSGAKAFSTPALERKFSRYKDKEAELATPDSVLPLPEQSDPLVEQKQDSPQQELQAPDLQVADQQVADLQAAEVALEAAAEASAESNALATVSIANVPTLATDTASDTTTTTLRKLHSPLLEKEVHEKKTQAPKSGQSAFLMDAAAILAVVVFATGLGYWGYSNYTKSESTRTSKLTKQTQAPSPSSELLSTYKALFAQSILSQNGLDAKQQASFDDAALQLGQEALAAGKIDEAQEYLKNVSNSSGDYAKAQSLLKSSTTTSGETTNQVSEPDAPLRRQTTQSRIVPTDRQRLSDRRVLSIPVIPEIESSSKQEPAAEQTSESSSQTEEPAPNAGNGIVIEMAGENSAGEAAATPSTTNGGGGVLTFSPDNAIRSTAPQKPSRRKRADRYSAADTQNPAAKEESPTPKFSESEISTYNRLLGKFISAHGQKAAQSEPPSFKEWIRKGKPAF